MGVGVWWLVCLVMLVVWRLLTWRRVLCVLRGLILVL